MPPDVIIIGLMAVPVALLLLLRINAALVFLSLCLGAVLVQFAGDDAVSIIFGASKDAHVSASVIKLALLLAPAILTMLFMIKTVKGHQRAINTLPALGTGLLTALLAVPLLPPGISQKIAHSGLWADILQFQSGIVAVSALACLLFLWMQRPKHGGGGEEKHGSKKHKG
jgi:hypothetical protein